MFIEQFQLIMNPFCKNCTKKKDNPDFFVKKRGEKYMKYCTICELLTENISIQNLIEKSGK